MKAQALVARNLRRLRVRQNLSQENLAVDAKVDLSYVSRLERGLENPTVGILERLGRATRCGDHRILCSADQGRAASKTAPGWPTPKKVSSTADQLFKMARGSDVRAQNFLTSFPVVPVPKFPGATGLRAVLCSARAIGGGEIRVARARRPTSAIDWQG